MLWNVPPDVLPGSATVPYVLDRLLKWLGRGHRYPNSLLIRTVRDFPLAKGVRIIEVGL